MSTPRQARALDVLEAEVNAHAPRRDKGSDGGKASPEHTAANPNSDHEALDGIAWTARDFTDDPSGGLDGSELAHLLAGRLGKHPAMMSGAYVIHNARIISYNRLSEGWRPYAGYNAHRTHVHVSVSDARSGYDSTQPWNLWKSTAPRPPAEEPEEPLVLTRLRNAWVGGRIVHVTTFDALIRRGTQPTAKAAKTARDKINAAMREFFTEVGR